MSKRGKIVVQGTLTELMLFAGMPGADDLRQRLDISRDGIDDVDDEGSTALHYAAKNNRLHNIALLCDRDANPHIRDKSGKTPADVAREAGYREAAETLAQAMKDFPLIRPEDVPARIVELEKTVADLARRLSALERLLQKAQEEKDDAR